MPGIHPDEYLRCPGETVGGGPKLAVYWSCYSVCMLFDSWAGNCLSLHQDCNGPEPTPSPHSETNMREAGTGELEQDPNLDDLLQLRSLDGHPVREAVDYQGRFVSHAHTAHVLFAECQTFSIVRNAKDWYKQSKYNHPVCGRCSLSLSPDLNPYPVV